MSKMKFRTVWDELLPDGESYSEEEPVYIPEKDENGMLHLVQHGVHNVYLSIQSHADENDLRQILQKAAATGDYSALNKIKPVFGDISGIPWDFTEAQNRALLAKKRFDQMDPQLRKLFKNFEDYRTQALTGNWSDDVVKFFTPDPEPAPAPEAKDE